MIIIIIKEQFVTVRFYNSEGDVADVHLQRPGEFQKYKSSAGLVETVLIHAAFIGYKGLR